MSDADQVNKTELFKRAVFERIRKNISQVLKTGAFNQEKSLQDLGNILRTIEVTVNKVVEGILMESALVVITEQDFEESFGTPDLFGDVVEFHDKFKITEILASKEPTAQIDLKLHDFRVTAMTEELNEYCEAVKDNNPELALDALIDLTVFTLGTAHLHGFNKFNEAWKRVLDANMKKKLAESSDDSKRNYKYDIVKPEDWQPPDLSDLVKKDK